MLAPRNFVDTRTQVLFGGRVNSRDVGLQLVVSDGIRLIRVTAVGTGRDLSTKLRDFRRIDCRDDWPAGQTTDEKKKNR